MFQFFWEVFQTNHFMDPKARCSKKYTRGSITKNKKKTLVSFQIQELNNTKNNLHTTLDVIDNCCGPPTY
jgi:hypothetical protein